MDDGWMVLQRVAAGEGEGCAALEKRRLGCFAAAGQSPTCQDQPVDPERQLLWKGPLAGLCLSSSRYTADGMFLSRTVRRGDTLATEWIPTGAVEIFYREVDEAELVRDEDNRP